MYLGKTETVTMEVFVLLWRVDNKLATQNCLDLDNDLGPEWLKLFTPNHDILYLALIYHPPGKDVDYIRSLRTVLSDILARHCKKPPNVILAGDFNYYLLIGKLQLISLIQKASV